MSARRSISPVNEVGQVPECSEFWRDRWDGSLPPGTSMKLNSNDSSKASVQEQAEPLITPQGALGLRAHVQMWVPPPLMHRLTVACGIPRCEAAGLSNHILALVLTPQHQDSLSPTIV